MFLEGEVDWVLVMAIVAGISVMLALAGLWFGATRGARHAGASDELQAARRAATLADKRLFETLNAIPVALVETDPQGKFVFANRAAHQLLGRRDAELLGLRFHSATWGITYPDGRPVPPDLLPSARALRGQTVKGFQHILANPANRKKMLVSVTAMPIEDEMGRIVGSTAAIVETEGLTTPEPVVLAPEEPAPQASAPDLTRRVFEAAASALVVVGPDGRVLEANPQAQGLLDGRQALGGDFADLYLAEADRVVGRQTLRAVLTGHEDAAAGLASPHLGAHGVAWRILALTGEDGRAEALLLAGERAASDETSDALAPQDAPEEATDPSRPELETLAAERDAARAEAARLAEALARAQRQLDLDAQAARTEQADARRLETVGRLTGGVAQDFSALLSVMTSALDLMLKQAEEPERVRRLGRAALAAGQRGETLTRRLAAFSQGEDDPGARELDAAALTRGLEGRLRHDLGADQDLMVEAPADPLTLRVDPVGFEAAVRALVRNAAEASGPGGSIAVRLSREGDAAVLSVRDAGPGMSAEILARAPEPFFTTRPGRAGLGLSEAHALARRAGGVLELDSVEGQGTEARIRLPLGSGAAESS